MGRRIPVVLAALALLVSGFGDARAQSLASGEPAVLASPDAYAGTVTPSGGFTGDVVEGAADAPVTIIEYASLTCPHCASFHRTVYPALKADYIDTGKVKFIYRDFPLNPPAIEAAVVARCAGSDGYLTLIDRFLTQQADWTRAPDWKAALHGIAMEEGLSADRIEACVQDLALGQIVLDRYVAAGQVFGVNRTPTLVIDGVKYEGDLNPAALGEVIDARM